MTYKKQLRPVNSVLPGQKNKAHAGSYATNSIKSWLPEYYKGPAAKQQRYQMYDVMDMDNEIHTALDTLADFSTELDDKTNLPFLVNYSSEPTSTETVVINRALRQWCTLNEFKNRLWGTFRTVLKYGDMIYVRDPMTYKLFTVDTNNIVDVMVNEADGKKVEAFRIKNVDMNMAQMTAGPNLNSRFTGAAPYTNQTNISYSSNYVTGAAADGEPTLIDANHIVHLTLCDGTGPGWPFGESILDQVYKVFKQKELLEDAVLIYRVHRAPERRVFYVDCGAMPPHQAQAHLEKVKLDTQQKRVPGKNGNGTSITDAAYSPMSQLEDYFIAVTSDGRGSKVDTLPGGENLGSIDDLRYFNNKMLRALGVPTSYLPTGPDDGSSSRNDGRVGAAFIQEFRFSKVCERYQRNIIKALDQEFKMYLKFRGISIDNSLFELSFTPPQSFSEYRRMELDAAHINIFNNVIDQPFISRRFALKRYLGWTDEEIHINERMWREESGNNGAVKLGPKSLRDVGMTSSGIDSMAPDAGFDDTGVDDDISNIADEFNDASDDTSSPPDDLGTK